jgi:uncharacterized protein YndB with AHSA1/START domain
MNTLAQLDAVERAVTSRLADGRPANVVRIRQTYTASRDDVWDACTNPERIPRWLMPISGDLRLGGTYQLHGNASGTILACEPGQALAITWEYGGEVSWVDVTLSGPDAGPTTLTVEHAAPADDPRWKEFGPGAVGIGWDMMVLGLAQHLTGGGSITPEEALGWTASEEGRAFMTGSGDRWRKAHVASGEPPEQAKAAADRTLAAYTGSPDAAEAADAEGVAGSQP